MKFIKSILTVLNTKSKSVISKMQKYLFGVLSVTLNGIRTLIDRLVDKSVCILYKLLLIYMIIIDNIEHIVVILVDRIKIIRRIILKNSSDLKHKLGLYQEGSKRKFILLPYSILIITISIALLYITTLISNDSSTAIAEANKIIWQVEAALAGILLPLLILILSDIRNEASIQKAEMLLRVTNMRILFTNSLLLVIIQGINVLIISNTASGILALILLTLIVYQITKSIWKALFYLFHPNYMYNETCNMIIKDLYYQYDKAITYFKISRAMRKYQTDSKFLEPNNAFYSSSRYQLLSTRNGIMVNYNARYLNNIEEYFSHIYQKFENIECRLHLSNSFGKELLEGESPIGIIVGTKTCEKAIELKLLELLNNLYIIDSKETTVDVAIKERLSFIDGMLKKSITNQFELEILLKYMKTIIDYYIEYISKYIGNNDIDVITVENTVGNIIIEEYVYGIFIALIKEMIITNRLQIYEITIRFLTTEYTRTLRTVSNKLQDMIIELLLNSLHETIRKGGDYETFKMIVKHIMSTISGEIRFGLPYSESQHGYSDSVIQRIKWSILSLLNRSLKIINRADYYDLLNESLEEILQESNYQWRRNDRPFFIEFGWDFAVVVFGLANWILLSALYGQENEIEKKQTISRALELVRILNSKIGDIDDCAPGFCFYWNLYTRSRGNKEYDKRFGWVHWEISLSNRKTTLVKTWDSFAILSILLISETITGIDQRHEGMLTQWIVMHSERDQIRIVKDKLEAIEDIPNSILVVHPISTEIIETLKRIMEKAENIKGQESLKTFLETTPDKDLIVKFKRQIEDSWQNQGVVRLLFIENANFREYKRLKAKSVSTNTVISRDYFWEDVPYGISDGIGEELGKAVAMNETIHATNILIDNCAFKNTYATISNDQLSTEIDKGINLITSNKDEKVILLLFNIDRKILDLDRDTGTLSPNLPKDTPIYSYNGFDVCSLNIQGASSMILCVNMSKIVWKQKALFKADTTNHFLNVKLSEVTEEEAQDAYQRSQRAINTLIGKPEDIDTMKDIFRKVTIKETFALSLEKNACVQYIFKLNEYGIPIIEADLYDY